MYDVDETGIGGNRAQRRAAGHRGPRGGMTKTRRTAMGLVSAGLAVSVAAGVAVAEPSFNPLPPSASNPTPQTTNPTPPAANVGPGAIPDPPATSGWRENPHSNNAPVNYAPIGVEQGWDPIPSRIGPVEVPPPPPMILPEPGMIRIGKYQEVKPPWVTMAEMNSINRWSAYIESRIAQFWLSQGLSQDEADRRAASMMVGGVVGGVAGGAAGFALGVVPGVLAGAGIGALVGTGIGYGVGLATGVMLLPVFGPAGPPLMITQGAVGALIGAPVGAAVGAVIGGAIGGVVVGIPGAAIGIGLGSLFGGGDPNQDINQPWLYRDGSGMITPKDNKLEFDWDATESPLVPNYLNLPEEGHINIQVKDDNTYVLKLGEERWLGATEEERDKHFYGEIDKTFPGAGQALKSYLEDEKGPFQTEIKKHLRGIADQDPANAQYNPHGDIKDTDRRAERVPYPTTSTPDRWDEPNREGVDEQNRRNQEGVGTLPPVDPAQPLLPSPIPAPQPAAASVTVSSEQAVGQSGATLTLPKPVQDAVDSAPAPVQKAVSDAQSALGALIPSIPGA